jgi:glycosyltransferase involved in cell wall biosynthesis
MTKLSIILPSLRFNNLFHCIQSIQINTSLPYEILIITSPDIATAIKMDTNSNVRVFIDEKCTGPVAAINQAVTEITGDYVVSLSDDCRVCPGWDKHMINFLQSQDNNCVILGNFRVYDSSGEMPSIGYYGRQFSMFPIISKKHLDILSTYYSPEYNAFYSDPDLGMRVYEIGKVVTCPTAFIYHPYNPDELHKINKTQYFQSDEKIFINKWSHLGTFRGCEKV